MKKINTFAGIIALSLGLSAFSYSNTDMNRPSKHGHKRIEMTPEMKQKRIVQEEKEIAIKKELIKDNPNWTQIEKLNKEIANDRAIMKTARMKQMKENSNNRTKN